MASRNEKPRTVAGSRNEKAPTLSARAFGLPIINTQDRQDGEIFGHAAMQVKPQN